MFDSSEREYSKVKVGKKRNKLYALVYHRLFDLYCLVGDYKNAIHSGEKAFPLYREIGEFESATSLLDKIGDLCQFSGEDLKAIKRYEEAFIFYSSVMMVSNLYGIPVVRRKELLNKMLAVITKIGDKEREGWLVNQLDELSLSLFEYPEAQKYFQKELAISRETGNIKEEGRSLRCLGNLHRRTEEYQQGKQHYEEAIEILEATGEIKELGVACGELGKVYNVLREFQKAKTLQMKALGISVEIGDSSGEAIDYRSLADVHTHLLVNVMRQSNATKRHQLLVKTLVIEKGKP